MRVISFWLPTSSSLAESRASADARLLTSTQAGIGADATAAPAWITGAAAASAGTWT